MRYRRAERCTARAEEALRAGREDEARAALAEARALNHETLSFDEMVAVVRQRTVAVAAAKRAHQQRIAAAAVFLIMAIGAGTFGLWLRTSGAGSEENTAIAASPGATPPASAPVTSSGTTSPPRTQTPVQATQTTTPIVTELPVRTSGNAAPNAEAPAAVADPAPARPDEPALPPVRDVSPSLPLDRPTTVGATESPIPRINGPDGLVGNLPTATLPVVTLPSPTLAPAAQEIKTAEPPPVSEEPRVRAVLAQFEAAYTSLSAAAAQAVWPSVDAGALGRAFDSLESQRVSLGRCSIVIKGANARADCRGITNWTPKIGGGRRTESRRWEFDLVAENGSWHILQASARK